MTMERLQLFPLHALRTDLPHRPDVKSQLFFRHKENGLFSPLAVFPARTSPWRRKRCLDLAEAANERCTSLVVCESGTRPPASSLLHLLSCHALVPLYVRPQLVQNGCMCLLLNPIAISPRNSSRSRGTRSPPYTRNAPCDKDRGLNTRRPSRDTLGRSRRSRRARPKLLPDRALKAHRRPAGYPDGLRRPVTLEPAVDHCYTSLCSHSREPPICSCRRCARGGTRRRFLLLPELQVRRRRPAAEPAHSLLLAPRVHQVVPALGTPRLGLLCCCLWLRTSLFPQYAGRTGRLR